MVLAALLAIRADRPHPAPGAGGGDPRHRGKLLSLAPCGGPAQQGRRPGRHRELRGHPGLRAAHRDRHPVGPAAVLALLIYRSMRPGSRCWAATRTAPGATPPLRPAAAHPASPSCASTARCTSSTPPPSRGRGARRRAASTPAQGAADLLGGHQRHRRQRRRHTCAAAPPAAAAAGCWPAAGSRSRSSTCSNAPACGPSSAPRRLPQRDDALPRLLPSLGARRSPRPRPPRTGVVGALC